MRATPHTAVREWGDATTSDGVVDQTNDSVTGTYTLPGVYTVTLTVTDEALTPSADVDLFRIKIWDKDNNDEVVYDNQMGDPDDSDPTTEIGGGSIVIHDN